jgi:hypothetical protein
MKHRLYRFAIWSAKMVVVVVAIVNFCAASAYVYDIARDTSATTTVEITDIAVRSFCEDILMGNESN